MQAKYSDSQLNITAGSFYTIVDDHSHYDKFEIRNNDGHKVWVPKHYFN